MGANPEVVHQVVIVPDDLPGISLKRMYLEPPLLDQVTAADVEIDVKGAELINAEDSIGRTKYLLRNVGLNTNEEIIGIVNQTLQRHGRRAIPLEGLSTEPTCREYAGFISRRAWEAAA